MELVVEKVWSEEFQGKKVETEAEHALYNHLLRVARVQELNQRSSTGILLLLQQDIHAKAPYMHASWGYIDAANIVSRVDECSIALQEHKKKDFLDPLTWEITPHPAIIATVEAVLLLFNVELPELVQNDAEAKWRAYWGLWIVKNIDAHTSGWEWVATNEPTGLFTKPYALSATHLERISILLDQTNEIPDSHRCWQPMKAYACLRNWAVACAAYVHMLHHCLPEFPAFNEIQTLITPPRRSSPANVWFRVETPDHVEYFYNRLLQSVQVDKPSDFDGNHVTPIPFVVKELIEDALHNDPATRLELEKRGKQRIHAQLLAEDEWVECFDLSTQKLFYYSIKHYRISWARPNTGAIIPSAESMAYAAVLRLQAAYRRRRLQQKLLIKQTKRNSLPVFSTFTSNKYQFY